MIGYRLNMILCGLMLAVNLYGQHPSTKHYTVDDGIPSSEVYHVIQDRLGYIWFATDHGVSRFDGYTFTHFNTNEGLTDNTVFKLLEDSAGRIWCMTFTNQYCFIENGKCQPYAQNAKIRSLLKTPIPLAIKEIKSGVYLVGLSDGFITFDLKGNVEYAYDAEKAGVHSMLNDDLALIYTVTGKERRKMLYVDANQHYNEYELENSRPYHVGTLSGIRWSDSLYLISWKDDLIRFGYYGNLIGDNIHMGSAITCIGRDKDQLFVGTKKNGLYILDESFRLVHQYLDGYSITSTMRDSEGGLWFTTLEAGVFYMPSNLFQSYSTNSGLADNYVSSMMSIGDSLLLGMGNGYVQVLDKNDSLIEGAKLSDEQIDALFFDDKANAIWLDASTSKSDLKQLLGKKLIKKRGMNFFHRDHDAVMWSGNLLGMSRWETVDIPQHEALVGDYLRVNTAYPMQDGTWLIGGLQGLYLFNGNEYEPLSGQHALLGERVEDILGKGDTIILATKGAGVVFLYHDKCWNYTEIDGLCSNMVNDILLDGMNLWVATNEGLSCINLRNAPPSFSRITKYQGLASNEIEKIYARDDKIYASTKKGLTIFQSDAVQRVNDAPELFITLLSVNAAPQSLDTGYSFSYDQNDVEIGFTALSFRNAGEVNYRHRLYPVDKQWVYTQDRKVRYPTLPPGDYLFEVQTMSIDGDWNENGKKLTILIHPPFWKMWWFRSAIILLVGLLIYSFFKIRVFTYNRDVVRELLQLLVKKFRGNKEDFLFVKSVKDGTRVKIPVSSLLYIEAARDYMIIFTSNKKHLARITMKELEEQFNGIGHVVRVHRSYLVNLENTNAISPRQIVIGETKIPVGRTYKKKVREVHTAMQRDAIAS